MLYNKFHKEPPIIVLVIICNYLGPYISRVLLEFRGKE